MENEQQQQSHDSSNSSNFCFRPDECGNLTRQCILDQLAVMRENERGLYHYDRFLPSSTPQRSPMPHNPMMNVEPEWRASIVKWSYSVVDYFDLSREVVAISMALFDRFFATGICRPSSDTILLCSIATLHIAIKMRESAIIKISTLAWFGRGRFSENRITNMEQVVLSNLNWLANPPTAISIVMHLLLLLPGDINLNTKRDILERARFLAELSVADSFFIAKLPSIVGLAAIMNSLSDASVPLEAKTNYLNEASAAIGASGNNNEIVAVQRRLRLLSAVNGG